MTNKDILNGSQLIVEIEVPAGMQGVQGPIVTAFSTSHSFNITTSQEDVLTKEFGRFPGKVQGTVEWEVSCENLAGDQDVSSIGDLMKIFQAQAASGEPVTLKFGNIGDQWNDGKGTYDSSTKEVTPFAGVQGTPILEGPAIISSLSLNASAGENATISATFTGAGPISGWND